MTSLQVKHSHKHQEYLFKDFTEIMKLVENDKLMLNANKIKIMTKCATEKKKNETTVFNIKYNIVQIR